MYPTHMASHFQKRRLEMHLSLTQLAKLVGYRNMSKGHRKIDTFERTGAVPSHPVRQADGGVGDRRTDDETDLEYEDYKDWLRRSRQSAYTLPAADRTPGLPWRARRV